MKSFFNQSLHDFFEKPVSKAAIWVQSFIFFLIFASVFLVFFELTFPEIAQKFAPQVHFFELFILGVFTIEYLLRFFSARNKTKFFFRPLNLIDLLAIVPFYFGIENAILLRILRVLRLLKILKYAHFLNFFQFRGTIFQKILPLMAFFGTLKCGIWLLESRNIWIEVPNLSELFAIIGFALGIVLAQKIAASHQKYLQIEEILFQLHGQLLALEQMIEHENPKKGTKVVATWLESFLIHLEDEKSVIKDLDPANRELYSHMQKLETHPAEMAIFFKEICSQSAFVFGKKNNSTPPVYDNLLQQATILYLFLMVIFIAGPIGLISVLAATYLLYGMFQLTLDFDSIIGGEHDLINIDLDDLHLLLQKFKNPK